MLKVVVGSDYYVHHIYLAIKVKTTDYRRIKNSKKCSLFKVNGSLKVD